VIVNTVNIKKPYNNRRLYDLIDLVMNYYFVIYLIFKYRMAEPSSVCSPILYVVRFMTSQASFGNPYYRKLLAEKMNVLIRFIRTRAAEPC
jgi:hypothetical protein